MSKLPEPIYSDETERSLLGVLLREPTTYAEISHLVRPDDFYIKRHSWIYEAIEQAARNGGISYASVADELGQAGKLDETGGKSKLIELAANVVSLIGAETYAQRIAEDAHRRRLESKARDIWKLARDTSSDIADVQSRAEGVIIDARREQLDGFSSIESVVDNELELMSKWQSEPLEPGETRGLPVGMKALDKMLGGLYPGYYLVAGRPSIGKTSLLLQMLDGLCSAGIPCLLFSIEMSAQQNVRRIACRRSGVGAETLRRGEATPEMYGDYVAELGAINDWPLVICDDSIVRPMDVLAQARRYLIERDDLGAIFIDGIWLMTPERQRENRTQTVGSISRSVKRIQRELDVPVVAAHQLSRSCEKRADKRPILSDLRDSGDLEQDADVVLMLYRDDYYNPDTEEQNIAEVWVRKNRLGGPTGEVAKFFWRGRLMAFMELEIRQEPVEF